MNKCGSGSPSLLPPSLPPSLPHLFDMFHAMLFIGCPTPRENKFFGRIDIFKCVKDIKEMGQVLAWIPHAEGRERRREGGEQSWVIVAVIPLVVLLFHELAVCMPGR